jgi:hypothetical protein
MEQLIAHLHRHQQAGGAPHRYGGKVRAIRANIQADIQADILSRHSLPKRKQRHSATTLAVAIRNFSRVVTADVYLWLPAFFIRCADERDRLGQPLHVAIETTIPSGPSCCGYEHTCWLSLTLGLPAERVNGLLLSITGKGASVADLQLINAFRKDAKLPDDTGRQPASP